MNERIREILKQATQYADSLGPIDGAEWCDAEYSKFAELIVQDCVSEVALMGVTNFENEAISWACRVIIDGIKKKFGV
jgi:hypothetical protein